MFGVPSLGKIVLLGIAVLVVWYGAKIIGRLQRSLEHPKADDCPEGALEPCPLCGVYTSAGRKHCGREGCPMS